MRRSNPKNFCFLSNQLLEEGLELVVDCMIAHNIKLAELPECLDDGKGAGSVSFIDDKDYVFFGVDGYGSSALHNTLRQFNMAQITQDTWFIDDPTADKVMAHIRKYFPVQDETPKRVFCFDMNDYSEQELCGIVECMWDHGVWLNELPEELDEYQGRHPCWSEMRDISYYRNTLFWIFGVDYTGMSYLHDSPREFSHDSESDKDVNFLEGLPYEGIIEYIKMNFDKKGAGNDES